MRKIGIFIIFLCVNFSLADSMIPENFRKIDKRGKFIGNLINQWNRMDHGTHDVYIYKMADEHEKNIVEDTVESLLDNVPVENPVAVIDLMDNIENYRTRPGAFMIVLSSPDEIVS